MKRLAFFSTMLAALWGIYGLAGRGLANWTAERFGPLLLKLGEGKFGSAEQFIHRRMFESAWLITLLGIWIVLQLAIGSLVSRSNRWRQHRWLVHALVAFVALNLWTSQANRTAAFWIAQWDGPRTQNLTRFHIKRILALEQEAPNQAALIGSSQTRAQIDEALLNHHLGPRLRTTDLNYPGAKALDVLLMHKVISTTKPDYLIWYISEGAFYSGSSSEVIPNFLTVRDLPDLVGRGAAQFVSFEYLASAILGDFLPIFRLREVLSQRVLGPEVQGTEQIRYDASLESDLAARAQRAASYYRVNEESRMQQKAMEDFIRRCQGSGQKVILLAGQLHPTFESALDPALRPAMLSFLRQLADKYPHVTLMENLPRHSARDYDDLTHVNRAAQENFSRFLAFELDRLLSESSGRPR